MKKLFVKIEYPQTTIKPSHLIKEELIEQVKAEILAIYEARNEAIESKEQAIEEAVNAKAAQLHSVHASAIKEAGYKHELASAELHAQVEALRKENTFLVSQLHEARGNLAAEREARVQIAASEARRQGWSKEDIQKVIIEAQTDDYDHLLDVYFEHSNDEDDSDEDTGCSGDCDGCYDCE